MWSSCATRKTNKTKKVNSRKTIWSKNSLKTTLLSRTVSQVSKRNVSRIGLKKGSFVESLDGPTLSIQEEVCSVNCKSNLNLIKEAKENMEMSVRCGENFHGRKSFI